ncbi:MAG TPA: hypothetical protein PL125_06690 [Candidatus Omnitrophota bacterium]|nr:hypothetical protein [Candidatus Omnitrophota bacterium]
MNNQTEPKWYFRTWSLIVSFLCVGPFMLPLVWTNPRFTKRTKIIISIIVIAVTCVLTEFFLKSLKTIAGYYQFSY